MPSDPANLMEQIYDLLSSLYPNTAGTGAFLAFEKLGMPVSPDMFRLQPGDATMSPALAIERLSQIANAALVVNGDSVQHTDRTVDAQLQLLVQQSMASTPDTMASLGAAKGPAGQAFDGMALGSLEGPFTYHPTYATPADWYDPATAANWTAHTIGQASAPQAGTPPPPRPIAVSPPVWRVVPPATAPALAHPVSPVRPVVAAAPPPRPVAAVPVAHPPAMHPPAAPPPVHPAPPAPPPHPYAAIMQTATVQPMTATSVAITFEHCIVTLTRPWFPQGFLLLRDWYLPGYSKGDFSHGTGPADTGLLPLVPTGFVAIRNLSIRANWSDQDRAAAQQSASFGPFSLVGRNFDANSGTLSCPGIQIIGWFLAPLPVLPPTTDPALLPAPPPTPSPQPSALDILTNPQVDSTLIGGLTGLVGAAEQLSAGSPASATTAPAQTSGGTG